MKSSFNINFLITVILAIVGYFTISSLSAQLTSSLAMAVGILIGGLLVPVISQLLSTGITNNSEPDNGDVALKTLYVGNLPYRANEAAIMELFSPYGHVNSVRLMKDRRTGKRKGYGFVEIAAKSAKKAVASLNDSEFQERTLKVRMAKEKSDNE